ncbi:MAG TPA: hypothetical protein DCM08_08020, partial [Microscillaceae bacterium]|nr:hypothetical protein [Microscillaceae bacterium]
MKAYHYIIWIGGGLLWAGLLVFAWSCTRTVNLNPDNLGARYFPLETGNFVEYQVRETIFTTTEGQVTRNFLLREVVR